MTRKERVRAALAGKKGDRIPWTVWPHCRAALRGDAYVRVVLEWWHRFQPDLLKLPVGEAETLHEYASMVQMIRAHLPADDPPVLLGTVPGVLARAEAESGGGTTERLRDAPKATHSRLREIAAEAQAQASLLTGEGSCDGVFVAVHLPEAAQMSGECYAEVLHPLEREVLAGGGAGWCNVAHLHGGPWSEAVVLGLTEDVPIVSWSDRRSGPTLAEMRAFLPVGHCLMGGLNEQRIAGYSPEQIAAEIAGAVAQTAGGQGLIVAPGCTVAAETPVAVLEAIAAAVSTVSAAATVQEAMDQ